MTKTGRTLTSKELAEAFIEQQIEKHENPEGFRGLSFGHSALDEKTGRVQRGDLIVISGKQKAGKSTIALALAVNFAFQLLKEELEEYILHVSLEMRHNIIASKIFSKITGLDVNKFRDIKLDEDDWIKVHEGAEELASLPVFWNVACYEVPGILEIISDLEKEHGLPRVVIVDYFQLMSATNTDKRHEQLRTISRQLKELAMTKDITVILLAQQTREASTNVKKQKAGSSLAGTQGLEQDLDLLLLILPILKDEIEVPHLREIWIALARNAEMQTGVTAYFSGNYVKFGMPAAEDIQKAPQEDEQDAKWLDW
jgi:replicative DNA helicase